MQSTRKERTSWYLYDWAVSAFTTTVLTVFLGPYLTGIAENAAGPDGYINILGISSRAGSFFSYVVSISVILQVLILPIFGAIADYTNKKKLLLGIFAYIGSFATMSLFFLEGQNYLFGGIIFIIANLSFGVSMVMYNAFLGELAEKDKRDAVSSIGWGIGYLGGGILLALNLLLFINYELLADNLQISAGDAKALAVRINICSAGLWWAVFTIFPMIYLKVRKPVKKLKKSERVITAGFTELINTIKDALNYPKTILFLFAYLFYNDGVQAVIALSAQFGKFELGLEMDTLTQAILLVQFVAFGGAFLFNSIARLWNTKNAILLSLVIWTATVLYAYSFLNSEAGFYILAFCIAIVLGGTQALSRSLFSNLIPIGKEAEYFSLYEVSERGTSWLGPLMFGLSYDLTGSYRIAIVSLIVFFIIGFILLSMVNIKKAIAEAGN